MTTDYSKTPLAKKLGLKQGLDMILMNEPDNYYNLVEFDFTSIQKHDFFLEDSIDYIHNFCTEMEELETAASLGKNAMRKTGSLWISWPKKSSQIQTELNGNIIRQYILKIGLVDCKVASYDNNWSCMKFMYRVKDR